MMNAFVSMVMKLNEVSFKPLFLRLFHWATEPVSNSSIAEKEQAGKEGQVSFARVYCFFRLVNALSEKLKSIFVPYYGYLLDTCVSYLSGQKQIFPPQHKEKAKQRRETELQNDLLGHIMTALHKCFLYDTQGFITPDKFDKYKAPLLLSSLALWACIS